MELQTIDFLIGIGGGFAACLLTLACCFRPRNNIHDDIYSHQVQVLIMIYEHPVSIRDYKDYEVGGRFRFVNKKGKVAFCEVVGKYYKPKLNLYVIQTGTIEVKK